jgi:hypothetical protein
MSPQTWNSHHQPRRPMHRKQPPVLGHRPDGHRFGPSSRLPGRCGKRSRTQPAAEDAAGLRDLADYNRAFGVVLDDRQVA